MKKRPSPAWFFGTPWIDRTEEEQLAEVFLDFGPVVTIGRPGERLPYGGAARDYAAGNWVGAVVRLIDDASLVVARLSESPIVGWEIAESVARLGPSRVVLIVTQTESDYERVRREFAWRVGIELPEYRSTPTALLRRPLRMGSVRGFVVSDGDGGWEYLSLSRPSYWRQRVTNVAVPYFRETLRPVYGRAGISWAPSPLAMRFPLLLCFFVVLGALLILT